MRTVIETIEFQQQASKIWAEAQRDAFIEWIASNPSAGDVIPGASGALGGFRQGKARRRTGYLFPLIRTGRGAVDCGVCKS